MERNVNSLWLEVAIPNQSISLLFRMESHLAVIIHYHINYDSHIALSIEE